MLVQRGGGGRTSAGWATTSDEHEQALMVAAEGAVGGVGDGEAESWNPPSMKVWDHLNIIWFLETYRTVMLEVFLAIVVRVGKFVPDIDPVQQ